jgi:hypothetical protein
LRAVSELTLKGAFVVTKY